jgi:hypothetical protein
VPTLREYGIPVVQASFGGVLAPATASADVVAALESACDRAIRPPAYQDWARRANQVVHCAGSTGFERRSATTAEQERPRSGGWGSEGQRPTDRVMGAAATSPEVSTARSASGSAPAA